MAYRRDGKGIRDADKRWQQAFGSPRPESAGGKPDPTAPKKPRDKQKKPRHPFG